MKKMHRGCGASGLPTFSLKLDNVEDLQFQKEFIGIYSEKDKYEMWVDNYEPFEDGDCGYILFGFTRIEPKENKTMNLRTDEIGEAGNALKKLYNSLIKKKEEFDEEYRIAREESKQLGRLQCDMQNEISSVARAYKEITGKEL